MSERVKVIAAELKTSEAERSAVSPTNSLPVDIVQLPVLLIAVVPVGTSGRLLFEGVVLPVRPDRVMTGRPPGLSEFALQVTSSGTEGTRLTVMVLAEQGHGVLWLAVPVQVSPVMYNGALRPVPNVKPWLPIENGGACNDGDTAA